MRRRILVVLAVLVAIVLGIIWFAGRGGGYRDAVQAYKSELRARGEKFTVPDLPSAGTSYSGWLQEFVTALNNYNAPADRPPMMTLIGPGAAAVGHTNLTPKESAGYDEGVRLVAKLREALGTNRLPFNVKLGAGYQYNLDRQERLAAATAMQALATNDLPEAQAALFLAVDVVRLDDTEPTILSHLIRWVDVKCALEATWEALQDERWTEPQLAELQAKWEGMDLFSDLGPVWSAQFVSVIQKLAAARTSYQEMVNQGGPSGAAATSSVGTGASARIRAMAQELYNRYPGYRRWRNVTSFAEELYALQATDAALECAHQAEVEGAFAPAWQKYNERLVALDGLYPNRTNQFKVHGSADSSRTTLLYLGLTEAARRIVVAAVALKRFELAHHKYPASLSELVPEYLPQVPTDFMDGKPLRYKLQADGNFLLYSVGEDGVDNGGDGARAKAVTTGNWEWAQTRDVVWPRAATAKEVEDYTKAQRLKANQSGN